MPTTRQQLLQKIAQPQNYFFEVLALQIFEYQATKNKIYSTYLKYLGKKIDQIHALNDIPFLPISLFKTQKIKTGNWHEQTVFSSSGTSGQSNSQHFVRDLNFYLNNTVRGFEQFYTNPTNLCILALLPSYLEREGSSLVAMADYFIRLSKHKRSGFFLYNTDVLIETLHECNTKRIPTLLLGVSFALLDLAEKYQFPLHDNIIIMETGGMKGRRKEMTREALHNQIKSAFQVQNIHSEYGMTELLSQGYSEGNGVFRPAATLRVITTEVTDPLTQQGIGKTGIINIIDLANIDTCSFIATEDIGKIYENGSFEILGRLDNSDMRGCNLMVE